MRLGILLPVVVSMPAASSAEVVVDLLAGGDSDWYLSGVCILVDVINLDSSVAGTR